MLQSRIFAACIFALISALCCPSSRAQGKWIFNHIRDTFPSNELQWVGMGLKQCRSLSIKIISGTCSINHQWTLDIVSILILMWGILTFASLVHVAIAPDCHIYIYVCVCVCVWFHHPHCKILAKCKFHQPRSVICTFHRQGCCSRGGHLCNEHSEEKYSCTYKLNSTTDILIRFCVDKLYECILILMGLGERLWLLCDN